MSLQISSDDDDIGCIQYIIKYYMLLPVLFICISGIVMMIILVISVTAYDIMIICRRLGSMIKTNFRLWVFSIIKDVFLENEVSLINKNVIEILSNISTDISTILDKSHSSEESSGDESSEYSTSDGDELSEKISSNDDNIYKYTCNKCNTSTILPICNCNECENIEWKYIPSTKEYYYTCHDCYNSTRIDLYNEVTDIIPRSISSGRILSFIKHCSLKGDDDVNTIQKNVIKFFNYAARPNVSIEYIKHTTSRRRILEIAEQFRLDSRYYTFIKNNIELFDNMYALYTGVPFCPE